MNFNKILNILLFCFFITQINAQNFVCISVTNSNGIYLQSYGGSGTIYACHCVEPSDLLPYPGLTYVHDGLGFFTCDDAAYQNVVGSPICDISVTTSLVNTNCGSNTGSITLTASGGTGNYEYYLSGVGWVNYNVFNNLGSGNYTYSVRNADGTCETNSEVVSISNPISGLLLTATPTPCNQVTNKYDVSVNISGSGFPSSGNVVITIGSETQTINSPLQNPSVATFTGLISTGQNNINVNAVFSAIPNCTLNGTYSAPAACSNCPPITCGTTSIQKN